MHNFRIDHRIPPDYLWGLRFGDDRGRWHLQCGGLILSSISQPYTDTHGRTQAVGRLAVKQTSYIQTHDSNDNTPWHFASTATKRQKRARALRQTKEIMVGTRRCTQTLEEPDGSVRNEGQKGKMVMDTRMGGRACWDMVFDLDFLDLSVLLFC